MEHILIDKFNTPKIFKRAGELGNLSNNLLQKSKAFS